MDHIFHLAGHGPTGLDQAHEERSPCGWNFGMNGFEADFAISGLLSTRSRLSASAKYTLGNASVRWASGQVGSFS